MNSNPNPSIPKHIGFEIELGNHLLDLETEEPDLAAAEALVDAHGRLTGGACLPAQNPSPSEFDGEGFRLYLDHHHAEICSPMVSSATGLVLAMRRARSMIGECKLLAQRHVGPLRVHFNNTNRLGSAWAFHLNVLVTRQAFRRWAENQWGELCAAWMPFLCTSPLLFGAGKLGAENNAPPCEFQLSQRADFIDRVVGLETVTSKSLINTRNEPLADESRFARFHIICFDTCLCEFSGWLRFGVVQLLLALIEEGHPLPHLALADPIAAIRGVSRDAAMEQRLALEDGTSMTALEIQQTLAEATALAVERGSAASAVPEATGTVTRWLEILDDLRARRGRLARRLDWCARLSVLREVRARLGEDSRALRVADLQFAEVGGAFELLEQRGAFDRLEGFAPPAGRERPEPVNREKCRGLILSRFRPFITDVDWDHIICRDSDDRRWVIPLADPLNGGAAVRIVSLAPDWPACLGALRDRGLMEPHTPPVTDLFDERSNLGGEHHELV